MAILGFCAETQEAEKLYRTSKKNIFFITKIKQIFPVRSEDFAREQGITIGSQVNGTFIIF